MRVAIIGSGPTGMFLGAALARRGHRVTAVDRDAGPEVGGRWRRRGVMQFHHAHAFRKQVIAALQAELPEAYEGWLAAGAEPIRLRRPGGDEVLLGVRSRRETFERALRAVAARQSGLELRHGRVDAVLVSDGRARGVIVSGQELPADLVIDASGRSGRVTRGLRPSPVLSGDTGLAYVDRQYQLHAGAEPGPLVNPIAWQADLDGYQVVLFPHERGIFSVLIVRPTNEPDLVQLRHRAAFEAVCCAIPGLATWTDPERSRPITDVLAGGALVNHYCGQTGHDGALALPGLVFVGDAVCTTTPTFGRGVTTSLLQARELLRLLKEHGADVVTAGESFDAWCDTHMRPWVEDHVRMDEAARRYWAGEDIDLAQRIPSNLIMAAAQVDKEIERGLGPYLAMEAGPSHLDAVEPRARAVYASGWRPSPDPGPTRHELIELVRAAAPRSPAGMTLVQCG
jgi:2-polyprenyl-6-methoxyphenol hydroxylase-like FAD-dependent oxidoreductase